LADGAETLKTVAPNPRLTRRPGRPRKMGAASI